MEGSISPGPALVALKRAYKFALLVDEAHSFMALGSAGRGSFNHWEDAGYECSTSEVDIMSCMFSKSVGCTGGFVLANGIFANELRNQGDALEARGVETLSTIVLLRILGLLRKPLLIRHRMRMVREKAEYVAQALRSAGCRVLSSPGSAVICFPVGTVSQVAIFHGEATKMGVALAGAGPPATPIWGCRVRLCIFATTTWPDIYRLLTTVVHVGRKLRVRGIRPTSFDPTLLARCDPFEPAVKMECEAVDEELLGYVEELSVAGTAVKVNGQRDKKHDELVRAAGIEGLRKYGIGPCSARWFYGSFDVFIQLERRLTALYPSLLALSGQCRGRVYFLHSCVSTSREKG
jgi:serine palmitoyltransferase